MAMTPSSTVAGRRFPLLCSRCFVLLLVFTVAGLAQRQQRMVAFAAAGKVVTDLPGYDGRLPFYLETGYVEVDERHGAELFYYFVEVEEAGDAAGDVPFLFWLNGGDRCSVFSGLAYEIGPVRFVVDPYNGTLPRLRYNQNSWSKARGHMVVYSRIQAV